MAERPCFYCDADATHECPTCGRLYCPDHGDEACLRCIAPEGAIPSVWAYRGSLLALLAGLAVTAYLLLSPPATREEALAARVTTATPTSTTTPTPLPTSVGQVLPATPTPIPSLAPTATASPTPKRSARTYTIAAGDTLTAIAAEFSTSVAEIVALNPGLDPDVLSPGQVINLPEAP